jgi:hypothetical protein
MVTVKMPLSTPTALSIAPWIVKHAGPELATSYGVEPGARARGQHVVARNNVHGLAHAARRRVEAHLA